MHSEKLFVSPPSPLELEVCYQEASKEVDPAFEVTTFDGLDHETGEI